MSESLLSATFDLEKIVSDLSAVRQRWRTQQQRSQEPGGREFPSRDALTLIVKGLRGVLFPMRLGPPDLRQESEDFYVGHTLDTVLHGLLQQVRLEIQYQHRHDVNKPIPVTIDERAIHIVREFARDLPRIREVLDSDVTAAYEGDPAALSVDEVLLCYPGIEAVISHRLAHKLYQLGAPLLARLVAEIAHGNTGIDIHPGATIGPGLFIDHGTGVVIGETAVLGRRVRIYQAVTLGARSFPMDAQGLPIKGLARHPIVEDDVVIYAGATVLGRVTIGRGASIGGNVWVTHDVAPGAHVTQARSRKEQLIEGGWL